MAYAQVQVRSIVLRARFGEVGAFDELRVVRESDDVDERHRLRFAVVSPRYRVPPLGERFIDRRSTRDSEATREAKPAIVVVA